MDVSITIHFCAYVYLRRLPSCWIPFRAYKYCIKCRQVTTYTTRHTLIFAVCTNLSSNPTIGYPLLPFCRMEEEFNWDEIHWCDHPNGLKNCQWCSPDLSKCPSSGCICCRLEKRRRLQQFEDALRGQGTGSSQKTLLATGSFNRLSTPPTQHYTPFKVSDLSYSRRKKGPTNTIKDTASFKELMAWLESDHELVRQPIGPSEEEPKTKRLRTVKKMRLELKAHGRWECEVFKAREMT